MLLVRPITKYILVLAFINALVVLVFSMLKVLSGSSLESVYMFILIYLQLTMTPLILLGIYVLEKHVYDVKLYAWELIQLHYRGKSEKLDMEALN